MVWINIKCDLLNADVLRRSKKREIRLKLNAFIVPERLLLLLLLYKCFIILFTSPISHHMSLYLFITACKQIFFFNSLTVAFFFLLCLWLTSFVLPYSSNRFIFSVNIQLLANNKASRYHWLPWNQIKFRRAKFRITNGGTSFALKFFCSQKKKRVRVFCLIL